MVAGTSPMLYAHRNFMRSLVSSSTFGKLFNTLVFSSKLVVGASQCMRMSDGSIDGDKSREFDMKGGIAMNFQIFCLLYPWDIELTSDGEYNFLRFVQLGKVTSSKFSRLFNSNLTTNADGPNPFNATQFFNGSSMDTQISVKWQKRSISFLMRATTMQHKEDFYLKFSMHSSVNLLAFVKLKISFCCLSNASLSMRDWR